MARNESRLAWTSARSRSRAKIVFFYASIRRRGPPSTSYRHPLAFHPAQPTHQCDQSIEHQASPSNAGAARPDQPAEDCCRLWACTGHLPFPGNASDFCLLLLRPPQTALPSLRMSHFSSTGTPQPVAFGDRSTIQPYHSLITPDRSRQEESGLAGPRSPKTRCRWPTAGHF